MIYVLVRDAEYDDPGKVIFASPNKYLVESKRNELVAHHKRMCEIVNCYLQDKQKLLREYPPPPPQPDYAKLPLRDLVWNDALGTWNNAYTVEYYEEYNKYCQLFDQQEDKLQQQYADRYQVPLINMKQIQWFSSSWDFGIKEVEDNPAANICALW